MRIALLAVLLVVSACSVDNKPSSGLIVQVDSDLATPKDLDRVHVTVTQSGETLLDEDYAIGSVGLPPPLVIPVVFRGDSATANVDVIGYRLGQARVERSASSAVPGSRWALLRVRLDYLCLGRLAAAGGDACSGDTTCVQGACASNAYEESTLPEYQGVVGQAQATNTEAVSSCFDAVG